MPQSINYSYSWSSLLEQNGIDKVNFPPHIRRPIVSDWDKEMRIKHRKEARKHLVGKSLDELARILGRYCGPTKAHLSEKELGFIMPRDLVEKAIEDAAIEEILLGS